MTNFLSYVQNNTKLANSDNCNNPKVNRSLPEVVNESQTFFHQLILKSLMEKFKCQTEVLASYHLRCRYNGVMPVSLSLFNTPIVLHSFVSLTHSFCE
ncbi:unnamed protein product [Acanthosepion pharaonis]|uniref:Uncharacterized protein n=1 Tax=Acanthosepion pharaonis TaxID=158019 RepID=A0A812DPR3_ACAPH|nr:unnamed protein product [Sepia pharaonis]